MLDTIKSWFTLDNIKEWFLKVFLVDYLSSFLKRMDGYTAFLNVVLTILQVVAVMVTSPETLSTLAVLIKAFSDVASGVMGPEDITIVATSLMAIYGAIMRGVKKVRGVPQVPYLIVNKKDVRVANDGIMVVKGTEKLIKQMG